MALARNYPMCKNAKDRNATKNDILQFDFKVECVCVLRAKAVLDE